MGVKFPTRPHPPQPHTRTSPFHSNSREFLGFSSGFACGENTEWVYCVGDIKNQPNSPDVRF